MNDLLETNLKVLYKPLTLYYGEWNLGDGLSSIASYNKKGNMYEQFLDRYYYAPLNVIFNNDDIIDSFSVGICSRIGANGRTLFFSKRAFLKNVVSNIDDLIDKNGDAAYKAIKRAIRIKKDVYRDVYSLGKESKYYEQVLKEYLKYGREESYEDFVKKCKKQYTRLLNGYNSVINLFDKPINIDKFISCFDINKLYLYTCYSLLQNNKDMFNKYNNMDYSLSFVESYKKMVIDIRKKDEFYNSSIYVDKDNEQIVYTIDDLFKDLDEFKALFK